MRKTMVLATPLLLLVGLAACDGGDTDTVRRGPAVEFDTGTVRIETEADTFDLTVEIAEQGNQRAHGLMERDHLPADAGMIFLYPRPQSPDNGFYMFRTRIPLDIAFMDEDGEIVAIRQMLPCESPNPRLCTVYAPGVPYSSALEVNLGYFERHGIDLGDRVVFERD